MKMGHENGGVWGKNIPSLLSCPLCGGHLHSRALVWSWGQSRVAGQGWGLPGMIPSGNAAWMNVWLQQYCGYTAMELLIRDHKLKQMWLISVCLNRELILPL